MLVRDSKLCKVSGGSHRCHERALVDLASAFYRDGVADCADPARSARFPVDRNSLVRTAGFCSESLGSFTAARGTSSVPLAFKPLSGKAGCMIRAGKSMVRNLVDCSQTAGPRAGRCSGTRMDTGPSGIDRGTDDRIPCKIMLFGRTP